MCVCVCENPMKSNNFKVMQNYKLVNAVFMQNVAFLYSAGSNEITKLFQPAVEDLQRLHSKMLLGGLVRAEHVHHSLFSILGKSKVTPYSVAVVQPSPRSCSYIYPRIAVVLVIICSLLRVVGRREHRALLAGLPKAGISFCPVSCFWWNKPEGRFLKFLPFMCFLTGVYVVYCCRNHIVETKVEDDPTYAYGRSRASFRLEGAQKISELSNTSYSLLAWLAKSGLYF